MARARLVARPTTPMRDSVIAALRYLDGACFPGEEPCPLEGAYWWLLFTSEPHPVGFAGLKPLRREPDVGFLCRCGILPQERGRNLQRHLVHVREAFARKIGLRWLITYVARHNYASLVNLICCGYRPYQAETSWAGPEMIYLRKEITKWE